MTPFLLDDGRTLLVNRGFVPEKRRDPASRAEGQVAGPQEIEALLRTDGWKGVDFAKPPNKPEERFYFWLDLPVMAADLEAAGVDSRPGHHPGSTPMRWPRRCPAACPSAARPASP